jgi:hypothetical protein
LAARKKIGKRKYKGIKKAGVVEKITSSSALILTV